jgi:hypothetical protein
MMKKWRLASTALLLALLASPVLAAPQVFTPHHLESSYEGAFEVSPADLDEDGDVDILSSAGSLPSGEVGQFITWRENDGRQNFTEHVISGSLGGVESVLAVDLDGDRDLDVLAAAWYPDVLAWWENDGEERFTQHAIEGDLAGALEVDAGDIDGDGDLDVVCAAMATRAISWWENTPSGNPPPGDPIGWTKHTLDDEYYPEQLFAVDMDGDGDVDLLGSGHERGRSGLVCWWENVDGAGQDWTKHEVVCASWSSLTIYAADVDDDGDVDVLGGRIPLCGVLWWENDGNSPANFNEHPLGYRFCWTSSLGTADVDADGDTDVLSAGYVDKLAWWENTGGSPPSFVGHAVYDYFEALVVDVADVDGDCDIDVLSADRPPVDITWFENQQDFTLAPSSSRLPVAPGDSIDFGVVVTSVSGFTGPVALSISGLPRDAVASFSVNPVTPTAESIATISTQLETPPGSCTLQVLGTAVYPSGCSRTRSATVVLEVGGEEFVPEPGSYVLMAAGLAGLGGYAHSLLRRRHGRHVVDD